MQETRRIEIVLLCAPSEVGGAIVTGIFIKVHDHRSIEWVKTVKGFADEACDLVGFTAIHDRITASSLIPASTPRHTAKLA